MPRTSPSDDTISVTTRPHPPWRFTRRRKAVSVIPAIGATTNGLSSETLPIFMLRSFAPREAWELGRPHVGGVDFHADRLPDQIHGQHQACLLVLANESARHTLERTMGDFDETTLFDERTGVEREAASKQEPDAFDLTVRQSAPAPRRRRRGC